MTPLATKVVRKELELGTDFLLSTLTDSELKMFDVTAVAALVIDLIGDMKWKSADNADMLFLPASKTWIEWRTLKGDRLAVYLRMTTADEMHAGYFTDDGECFAHDIDFLLRRSPSGGFSVHGRMEPGGDSDAGYNYLLALGRMVAVMLVLINTPRIIGRRQHMPHAGLQREIARKKRMVGKFPLQAWTEVTLEVTPPKDASNDGVKETRLTGGKALHYCRAHLRIQNGKLVHVSAHWRGDPSLGIRQTRYAVVPQRA